MVQGTFFNGSFDFLRTAGHSSSLCMNHYPSLLSLKNRAPTSTGGGHNVREQRVGDIGTNKLTNIMIKYLLFGMGWNFWHYVFSHSILSTCFDVLESAIYENFMVI
jgi:hypothetical protein